MDALAISDRFLQNGASDQLLQLLIERGEENISGQSQGHSGNNNWSHSWQYCLRLKDKQLAARLALKYVHKCLFFSVEFFIMCINVVTCLTSSSLRIYLLPLGTYHTITC